MDLLDTTPMSVESHRSPLCGHCSKRERQLSINAKLKRCAGCSVAMYCSKDCQKAAWPAHKKLCQPAGQSLAGYAAPLSLFQSVNEWVQNTHSYAFSTLMNAAVQPQGGIAANFASPRIVVFVLSRVNEPKSPAQAFKPRAELLPKIVVNQEDLSCIFDNWEETEAAYQRQAKDIRAKTADPTYAGSLPAMVIVEGTEIAVNRPYPIYGLRSQHRGPINGRTRVLFEEVAAMCIGAMNAGFVLRGPPRGIGQPVPDIGVLVQRKKKWEWQKLLAQRWEWNQSGYQAFSKTGLPSHVVWALFHAL